MPPTTRPPFNFAAWLPIMARSCRGGVLILAGLFVLGYIAVALWRMPYPFDLEAFEGGTVEHVRRVLQGQLLYVRPSLDFVPFIYAPLYYYVCALPTLLMGVGYVPLRVVSFLASLGAMILVWAFVKKEGGRSRHAFLAVGLFAACFKLSRFFYDVARVDSLAVVLLLGALYLIRFRPTVPAYLGAALLLHLSFLTKQSAAFLIIPILGYCLPRPRLGAVFAVAALVLFGGGTWLIDYLHDGWYLFYTWSLPLQHSLDTAKFVRFWTHDLFLPLGVAGSLAVFFLLAEIADGRRESFRFYGLMGAGMLAVAWMARLHAGGMENNFLSVYAFLAILTGLGSTRLGGLVNAAPGLWSAVGETALSAALIIQLAALGYNPVKQIPTQADWGAGQVFLQTLKKIDGEVFAPYAGFLPTLAGKRTYAQGAAILDVLRAADEGLREELLGQIKTAIARQQFAALIMNVELAREDDPLEMEDYYIRYKIYYKNKKIFLPVAGFKSRPRYIYLPRREGPLLPTP